MEKEEGDTEEADQHLNLSTLITTTVPTQTLFRSDSTPSSADPLYPSEKNDETQKENENEAQNPDLGSLLEDLFVAPVEASFPDHREAVDNGVEDPASELVDEHREIVSPFIQVQVLSEIPLHCSKILSVTKPKPHRWSASAFSDSQFCVNFSSRKSEPTIQSKVMLPSYNEIALVPLPSPRLYPPPKPPDRFVVLMPSLILPPSHSLIIFSSKRCYSTYAHHMLDEKPQQDIVSWTASAQGYEAQGNGWKVVELFCDLKILGIKPIDSTVTHCIKAYPMFLDVREIGIYHVSYFGIATKICQPWQLERKGRCWSHFLQTPRRVQISSTEKQELVKMLLANVLISRYSNCGNPFDTCKLFKMMPQTYDMTWNALIDGLFQNRLTEEVMCLFKAFIYAEVKPDLIAFVSFLTYVFKSISLPAAPICKQGLSLEVELFLWYCRIGLATTKRREQQIENTGIPLAVAKNLLGHLFISTLVVGVVLPTTSCSFLDLVDQVATIPTSVTIEAKELILQYYILREIIIQELVQLIEKRGSCLALVDSIIGSLTSLANSTKSLRFSNQYTSEISLKRGKVQESDIGKEPDQKGKTTVLILGADRIRKPANEMWSQIGRLSSNQWYKTLFEDDLAEQIDVDMSLRSLYLKNAEETIEGIPNKNPVGLGWQLF